MASKIIGWLMKVYRNSPFHNAFFGRIFAFLLGLFMIFKGTKLEKRDIDGVVFDLDINQVIDSSLYYSGTYEPKVEEIIKRHLKPGMCALDIGANIGYHTLRMAKLVGPSGLVIAIEPTGWAIQKLTHNLSLNETLNNVKIIKVGLAEDDYGEQTVQFRSSYRLDGSDERKSEIINLTKLDTLMLELTPKSVDFIKLDVDGFESKVFKGAVFTIREYQPMILFEITPSELEKSGESIHDIFNLLSQFGYKFYNENEQIIPDFISYCEQLQKNFSTMILAKLTSSESS